MFRLIMVAKYAKEMQKYGISPAELLRGSNIEESHLNDRDYLISIDQYRAVVENMYRLSNDPSIGIKIGKSTNIRDLGLVGYAMISSHDLRQATEVWSRYGSALVGQYIETLWNDQPNNHEVIFQSAVEGGVLHRFETESALVRGMTVMRDLTGGEPIFHSISFSYPEPPYRDQYEELARCPLYFNAPQTVVRLNGPALDYPIVTMNEELFDICSKHCRAVMQLLPGADSLLVKLREIFMSRPSNLPELEESSQRLGISPATMRRRLASLGKSYQEYKNEFRFDLAREYLLSGKMLPKEVAYLLGFTTYSNFSRAFKTWSGKTIGDYVRQAIQ